MRARLEGSVRTRRDTEYRIGWMRYLAANVADGVCLRVKASVRSKAE